MEDNVAIYTAKSTESLLTAESERVNDRFNSCANRCYYCCFQATIAALLRDGIRATGGRWRHDFVEAQFVGQLINRRKRYNADLRGVLDTNRELREKADYRRDLVKQTQAHRALNRSRAFVQVSKGRYHPMNAEIQRLMTPAVVAAVDELKGLIAERYPQATFVVGPGFDEPGVYLVATVDVEDTDEVGEVYRDRLLDMRVEEGLPIYVNTIRPLYRVIADLRAREARSSLAPVSG